MRESSIGEMSQEDRATPGGPLREEPFVFPEQQQRSCRCAGISGPNPANSLENREHGSQSSLELPEDDGFVVINADPTDSQQEQHRHQDIGFERFSGLRTSAVELQSVLSGVNFTVDGENRFLHGNQKITSRSIGNKYTDNGEPENEVPEVELSENFEQHPLNGLNQIHARKDLSQYEEDPTEDRSVIDPVGPLSDRGISPVRNDDRPSTAASSVSFSTSCSSNEANNARVHGKLEGHGNEVHNRSKGSNVHHQLPVINDFNNSRSNLRLTRDNNKANVDGSGEVEEIHRVPSTPSNVGHPYSPGFRGLHNEHILQPISRQTNIGPKGAFDSIQVSASNTLEKGKCQCHHIQQHQHQHQQRLPNIQQREQIHTHHHHQHRHKLMQQQQQPRSQSQQQQQQYRHHHYHHPHQHIGQQQDLQRQQNDQLVGRNKHGGAGPEDDSDEMIETSSGTHQPPALPPRPPPRPSRRYEQNTIAAYDLGPNNGEDAGCCKKYVVLCCLCGGLSAAVGSLFLAVHAVLSAHTASLALFETVPSYIPGTMLILMGLFTILLARRKHRYGFLMKMCGSVGVVCALVCVLVTVTTTVVHMSRLQGLRECIYTERARSCTCYGAPQGRTGHPADPGVLFEGTPHCEAVHGALYDCLRALFGVSVAGILACIFSCMLLYQLLSHEKKKMYWEQLQLRCRSLYGQGGSGAVGGTAGGSCGCCNDCGGASPWWAQTPGNLYTPNPDLAPFSRRWRLPWSRSRGPAPTPDSNYGFHTQSRGAVVMRSSDSSADAGDNTPGPYSVLTDESQTGPAPYSLLNGSSNAPYAACTSSVASYSLLENGPLPALWGPPPPYSDPNSPARRSQLTEDRRPPTSARPPPPTAPSSTPVNVSSANRIANKRTIDNFETGNCEEYRQRGTPKRPSDNYENAEEVLSSSTDPDIEMGNLHQHHPHHHHPQHQQDEDTVKSRRIRKSLKGVENGGFQQESGNVLSKQSESELYFGDVSSCCGPESSFYDLALEKEQQSGPDSGDQGLLEYPTPNRLGKQRQPSKRSRLPLPLPALNSESSVASLTENYAALNNPVGVEEVSRNSSARGPFLAPDAQYEVIAQQTRYTYYNTKNGEHVLEIPLPSLASLAYRNSSKDQLDDIERPNGSDYLNDCQRVTEHCPVDGASSSTTVAPSPSPSDSSLPSSPVSHSSNATQRCPNEPGGSAIRDSTWQADQTRSQSSELVCPVNV